MHIQTHTVSKHTHTLIHTHSQPHLLTFKQEGETHTQTNTIPINHSNQKPLQKRQPHLHTDTYTHKHTQMDIISHTNTHRHKQTGILPWFDNKIHTQPNTHAPHTYAHVSRRTLNHKHSHLHFHHQGATSHTKTHMNTNKLRNTIKSKLTFAKPSHLNNNAHPHTETHFHSHAHNTNMHIFLITHRFM